MLDRNSRTNGVYSNSCFSQWTSHKLFLVEMPRYYFSSAFSIDLKMSYNGEKQMHAIHHLGESLAQGSQEGPLSRANLNLHPGTLLIVLLELPKCSIQFTTLQVTEEL